MDSWLANLLVLISSAAFRQLFIKSRKLIDIIYIDFQKALDSLVYSKILSKLTSYGICYEFFLYWIQSFLTDLVQRVFIDGVLSDPIAVSSVVVQDSVLGPLIFNLFINDIVDCFNQDGASHTLGSIFADDLKLYCAYNLLHKNSSLVSTLSNIEIIRMATLNQAQTNALLCRSARHYTIDTSMFFVTRSLNHQTLFVT